MMSVPVVFSSALALGLLHGGMMSTEAFQFLQLADLRLELPCGGLSEVPDAFRETLLDAIAQRIRTELDDRASRHYLTVLRAGRRTH